MVKIPINLPWLDSLADKETLHSLLRVVIIIAGYLLFRPYLDQIMRWMSGAPDTRQEQFIATVQAQAEQQQKQDKKQSKKKTKKT